MEESEEKTAIIITHFINPHMFWYREVQEDNMLLLEIDYKLGKYVSSITKCERFKLNDMVAVFYLPWSRYIRARVAHILDNISVKSYILWAIDYGIPVKSDLRYMKRLPPTLQYDSHMIHFGGIDMVIPADRIYDANTKLYQTQPKRSWSQEAVESLRNVINDSAFISFKKSFSTSDQHLFGKLNVTSHTNEAIDAAEYLLAHKYAVRVNNFSEKLKKLNTLNFECWEKNNKNLDFFKNDVSSDSFKFHDSTRRHKVEVDRDEQSFANEKVLDWHKRNQMNEVPITIDDISCDDSVSVIAAASKRQTKTMPQSIEIEDDDQYCYKIGGVLEKIKKTRYKDYVPPPPSDFTESVVGSILSRRRKAIATPSESIISTSNDILQKQEEMASKRSIISQRIERIKNKRFSENASQEGPSPVINIPSTTSSNVELADRNELNPLTNQRMLQIKHKMVAQKAAQKPPSPVFDFPSEISSNAEPEEQDEMAKKRAILKQKIERMKNERFARQTTVSVLDVPKCKSIVDIESNISFISNGTNQKSIVSSIVSNRRQKCTEVEKSTADIESSLSKISIVSDDNITVNDEMSVKSKHRLKLEPPRPLHKQNSSCISASSYKSKLSSVLTELSQPNKEYVIPAGFDLGRLQRTKQIEGKIGRTSESQVSDDEADKMVNIQTSVNSGDKGKVIENENNENQNPNSRLMRNAGLKIKEDSIISTLNHSFESRDELVRPKSNVFERISFQKSNEVALKSDFVSHLVLVHGSNEVKPVVKLLDTSFCQEVMYALEKRQFNQLYRTQTYLWEHLMRGRSAAIINKASTGKTMSYLPPICSLVKDYVTEGELPDTYGPVAIIVASSSTKVESIAAWCRDVIGHKMKIVSSYGVRTHKHTVASLLDLCAILVATPNSLSRLLLENIQIIDMDRLKIVVFDDVLSADGNFDDFLWKTFFKQKKNNGCVKYQTVVVSKIWQRCLKSYLRIAADCMLCIGDYLEAAVYARTHISIELRPNESKIQRIFNFIEHHPYEYEKLLIVCSSDEEVEFLGEILQNSSHSCALYTNSSSAEDIRSASNWISKMENFGHILVCTDAILLEIDVQNVQNLIHFTLPNSWTSFCHRFSVFFQYHDDYVQNGFTKSERPCARSLILLDANNNTQLPKLVKFMEDHGQTSAVPEVVRNVAIQIRIQQEEDRISENRIFCQKMLEFAHCSYICTDRHVLTKFDAPYPHIPVAGKLKFEIIKVMSVTHYKVRLLEHCAVNESTWQSICQSDEYIKFNSSLLMHFSSVENQIMKWPLQKNDICVYASGDDFLRCKILKIPPNLNNSFMKSVQIVIKTLDSGTIVKVKSTNILELPDEFKLFPAQAVDLRMSGVIPFDDELVWDFKATSAVRAWLTKDISPGNIILGKINFTLMDTIWVDNVIVLEKIEYGSNFIYKIDVKRSILEAQIGKPSDMCDQKLKEMVSQCGIVLQNDVPDPNEGEGPDVIAAGQDEENWDDNSKMIEVKSDTNDVPNQKYSISEEPVETWSSLKEDCFNKVFVGSFTNPDHLFVQNIDHVNSIKKLNTLYERIKTYMETDPDRLEQPTVGQCCITLYDGEFNRAKIAKLAEGGDSVQVYFCDIGFMGCRKVEDIFVCPNELIEHLPYQAIQAKLTGIKPRGSDFWEEECCDNIYDLISKSHNLYAYPVGVKRSHENCIFDFKSYDILLVDCTMEEDVKINQELVKNALAELDEETSHFLGLIVNNALIKGTECPEDNDIMHKPSSGEELEIDFEMNVDEIMEAFNIPKSFKLHSTSGGQKQEQQQGNDDVIVPKREEKRGEIPENASEFKEPAEVSEIPKTKKKMKPRETLLKATYRTPKTVWSQTESYVSMTIHAPDIDEYDFRIDDEYFLLYFEIESNIYVLHLHLYANVDAKMSAVNLTGLNLAVKLKKRFAGQEWPRLTVKKMKNRNISYDMEKLMFVDDDGDIVYKKPSDLNTSLNSIDDDDTDSEMPKFEDPTTFYDPLADEFE